MCTSTREKRHTKKTRMSCKKLTLQVVKWIIIQIHWLFDCFVDFIFGLYYDSKVQKVPPVKNELLLESAISLAKKIRERKVGCEVVVTAFIDRCKEVNSLLNAIVDDQYDQAIARAREVDTLLQNKSLSAEELKKNLPLFGVPFTTKESNEAKGTLHSMGTLKRKGHRSTEDADVVLNVKKAGAILIGKTNIPELNQWIESRNKIYGQTNNPYNTTRGVGGSSGGDAAIVAACGVPFAVGSDIGGSIRIPASRNGVFGFKPSEGKTSLVGIGLRKQHYYNSMAEAGPICKKAEDLDTLMSIFVGPNIEIKLNSEQVDVKQLDIFYQECSNDIRASKLSSAAQEALTKAISHLKHVTGSATKVKIPGTEYSYRLWRYWMTQEDADFTSDLTNNNGKTTAVAEIKKMLVGNAEVTLAAVLKLIDHDFFPKENGDWAQDVTHKMKKYLLEKLGEKGVLIYPTFNSARYHCAPFLSPFSFGYWAIFNVLKVPVCQVPMGLDKNGLPIGVQVVAAPNNDQLCIAVAKELEKAFGGWVPPS
ncbi:fatty-acid amide hydrolase 2-A-like [Trichogramma pretiosum]|uniref:fatty-acid amide hydrolase 2-A-like n=1 Tax=Trichogramma pretiosum TaxID=7493 RepID=UPI0006C99DED|nr:fatty-acid amide hydrolase 2-A-like [Trichogramma pretiosum]